jgi:hypothetical protein
MNIGGVYFIKPEESVVLGRVTDLGADISCKATGKQFVSFHVADGHHECLSAEVLAA